MVMAQTALDQISTALEVLTNSGVAMDAQYFERQR